MNRSTRKIVAAGAAMVFGVVVTNSVMAENAPAAAPQAAHAAPMKKAHVMKHKRAGSAEVKAIQEALNKGGAKLTVDGYLGKKTREALKAYQSTHGLKATGHADKKTREALGLKS
jgi:peptidoglycan hydrolase-like protein with peptidoglycan-binding domain